MIYRNNTGNYMKSPFLRALALLPGTFGVASDRIVFAQDTPPSTVQTTAAGTSRPAEALAGHALGAGDLIEVKVFQEADLDTVARVSADGKIVVPLIGEVQLGEK